MCERCAYRSVIADRIESAREKLALRWLEQLNQLLPLAPNEIFPGDELFGQVPELITQLSAFFRAPAEEAISATGLVTAKATEFGCCGTRSGRRFIRWFGNTSSSFGR